MPTDTRPSQLGNELHATQTSTPGGSEADQAKLTQTAETPSNGWYSFLTNQHVGDHVGILGLVVSVVGLIMTYREARKSRTAAEAARVAAEDARRTRQLVDTSLDLTIISNNLADLKNIIKGDDWSSIDPRIDSLCRSLATVKEGIAYDVSRDFNDDDLKIITDATATLRGLELTLAKKGAKPPSGTAGITRLHNEIIAPLSSIIDKINGICFKAKSLSARR
ncbi:hypothetical protein [Ralstonia sp. ASV6]|uniref:hypothetical protein n=1 Tax=Ralstonia sp. ASV6 TaxID=2795124 RepID=UPI0018ED9C0F|nr:hypothetical protein [Ralstonia sp. ASV6]